MALWRPSAGLLAGKTKLKREKKVRPMVWRVLWTPAARRIRGTSEKAAPSVVENHPPKPWQALKVWLRSSTTVGRCSTAPEL
jgi:hypothetical protein